MNPQVTRTHKALGAVTVVGLIALFIGWMTFGGVGVDAPDEQAPAKPAETEPTDPFAAKLDALDRCISVRAVIHDVGGAMGDGPIEDAPQELQDKNVQAFDRYNALGCDDLGENEITDQARNCQEVLVMFKHGESQAARRHAASRFPELGCK